MTLGPCVLVMGFDVLSAYPMARGRVFAAVGVSFWVGGLLLANWFWERLRGEGDDESASEG